MKYIVIACLCSSLSCSAPERETPEIETTQHALTITAPWGNIDTAAVFATINSPAFGQHTNRAGIFWYRWVPQGFLECWVDWVSPDHLVRASVQINFAGGHDFVETIRWWENVPCGPNGYIVTIGSPQWAGPFSFAINMGDGFDNGVIRHGPPAPGHTTFDGWTGDDWLYIDIVTPVTMYGWTGNDNLITLQQHANINIQGEDGIDCIQAPVGSAARLDCGSNNDFATAGFATSNCEWRALTCEE